MGYLVGDLRAHDLFRADFSFVGFGDDQEIVDATIEYILARRIDSHFQFVDVSLGALVDRIDAQRFAVDGGQDGSRSQVRRIHVRVLVDGVCHFQTSDEGRI